MILDHKCEVCGESAMCGIAIYRAAAGIPVYRCYSCSDKYGTDGYPEYDEYGIEANQKHIWDRIVALTEAGCVVSVSTDIMQGDVYIDYCRGNKNGKNVTGHHHANAKKGSWIF